MGFLETCVKMWDRALPFQASMFVTVDGSVQDAQRVAVAVYDWTGSVYRVGQPVVQYTTREGRLGVAVNKNTGLELLMDNTSAEHLFLCDDDTWPLYPESLTKHTDLGLAHSMVCWGKSRWVKTHEGFTEWNWPRGVVLYTHRSVVEKVGGMDERFGPGGHEHVEWSNRIHNAGLTPVPFASPVLYSLNGVGGPAMRASTLWHCEDMRRPGEPGEVWQRRKKRNTSIRRTSEDWASINEVMAAHEGDTSFVPFRAHENSRSSATLCSSSTCATEPGTEPETPRSEK